MGAEHGILNLSKSQKCRTRIYQFVSKIINEYSYGMMMLSNMAGCMFIKSLKLMIAQRKNFRLMPEPLKLEMGSYYAIIHNREAAVRIQVKGCAFEQAGNSVKRV